jgi:serine/threonine-protein kinase
MELLRGESVYTRVHRAGPVPLNEAVQIIVQCCKALGRAHSSGIVHRDIKPDNIFLSQSQDDDAAVVKILDFGIAKFASNPNDHGATRTGAVLGTPLYMSPEQARGLKTIDHRTDLYSLGLVAYTMLTGNLAFSSESFGDLLLQICTAPLPSLRANAPWLPPALETWFMRACAREPQDRFPSAQEFGEALKAACEGAVNASSLPGLAQSNPGGNPLAYGQTSAVSAIGASTASAATASGMSRSGVGADAITTPKSKAPVMAAVLAALVVVGGAAVAAVLTLSKKDPPAPAAATTAAATQAAGEPTAHAMPTATLAEPASTIALGAAGTDAGHGGEARESHDVGAGGGTVAGGSPMGGGAGPHPANGGHGGAPPIANHPPTGNHPTTAPTAGAIDLGY